MHYRSIEHYLTSIRKAPPLGPIAIILAEDTVELTSTLLHHMSLGFRTIILLTDAKLELSEQLAADIVRVDVDLKQPDALQFYTNQILPILPPDRWVYCCYNGEYLYFPFCETRSIQDLTTFHLEERRYAMLCYVIDLYAPDLNVHPSGVSFSNAHIDKSGYYSIARTDKDNNWALKDRQVDIFGGLRRRFENFLPIDRRKIDRIALFQSHAGLQMRPDFTLSVEEANTYSCPWHHNVTAAVLSFRAAKALIKNPISRQSISSFHWHNSIPCAWNSQQLLELGMIEPGQWF